MPFNVIIRTSESVSKCIDFTIAVLLTKKFSLLKLDIKYWLTPNANNFRHISIIYTVVNT